MQVIDFHTHLLLPECLNQTVQSFIKNLNPSYYAEQNAFSTDPDKFLSNLLDQGVDKAVVLPERAPATSCNVPTEKVVEFCSSHNALIPFASINPNLDPEPAGKLEYYIVEYKIKGLKLLPSYQFFYPNQPEMYPIYEIAKKYSIPIVFHIGSSAFKGTRLKYCHPIYLDDMAVDFPDIPIVMAHSGRGFWYEQCFFLSRLHDNIYMDITGLPPQRLLYYFPELDKNSNKIIFGSDWPGIPVSINTLIETIKDLPLSTKTIEGILYNNASSLLHTY